MATKDTWWRSTCCRNTSSRHHERYRLPIVVSLIVFLLLLYFVRERDQAQQKADALLLNVLPAEIAAQLKNDQHEDETAVIAHESENVSVLFADMRGFTPLSTVLSPIEMVTLLNEIFSAFDVILDRYGLEKIRTVGDSYMVASGAPVPREDHAEALCRMAIEMRDHVDNLPEVGDQKIEFRFGINSGPVVAGVIGTTKFHYDVWGDSVNIAARMESHGIVGKIQITDTTRQLLGEEFTCSARRPIDVKGKGQMKTWILDSVAQV